jgi:hypothetical protein
MTYPELLLPFDSRVHLTIEYVFSASKKGKPKFGLSFSRLRGRDHVQVVLLATTTCDEALDGPANGVGKNDLRDEHEGSQGERKHDDSFR